MQWKQTARGVAKKKLSRQSNKPGQVFLVCAPLKLPQVFVFSEISVGEKFSFSW